MKLNHLITTKTRGKAICPLFFLLAIFMSSIHSKADDYSLLIERRYETLIDSADYHASRQQWEEAEKATVAALRLRPANKANWLLWSNLAEIRLKRDNPEGALEAFNIGLSIKSDSRRMLEGRARIYLSEKKDEEALEDLDVLLKIDPKLEWPLLMRGYIYIYKDSIEKAETDFNTLIEAFPENSNGYSALASIKANKGEVSEAERLYKKSLEICADENVYFNLTALQIDNGKLTDATETVREGIKKFPRCGNLYLLRAYIHKKCFQNNEAEAALKLAVEFGADEVMLKKFRN